jgi:hypothetical protein
MSNSCPTAIHLGRESSITRISFLAKLQSGSLFANYFKLAKLTTSSNLTFEFFTHEPRLDSSMAPLLTS